LDFLKILNIGIDLLCGQEYQISGNNIPDLEKIFRRDKTGLKQIWTQRRSLNIPSLLLYFICKLIILRVGYFEEYGSK
jgi:hypothetical protein